MITNATAVRYCNEAVRGAAQLEVEAYRKAKALVQEWNASAAIQGAIPNTSEVVNDGADVDGRPVITGAMVTNVVTRAMELIADLEANSNAKLNTLLAVAVR